MRLYIKGDCHGDFSWVKDFCEKEKTTRKDVIIIAGDHGVLFFGKHDEREIEMKNMLTKMPITFLFVRGNHDGRPEKEGMKQHWSIRINGRAYWEPGKINLIYATDGGFYKINNKVIATIGGAYSVDKEYRQLMGLKWHEDEELHKKEMDKIYKKFTKDTTDNHFDYIITHTAPISLEPKHLFLDSIDQSKVSKKMEYFLEKLKKVVNYKCWFYGHYHGWYEWPRENNETAPSYENPAHYLIYNDIILLEDTVTGYSFLNNKGIEYV